MVGLFAQESEVVERFRIQFLPQLKLILFQISHYAGICNKRLERIGVGGRLSPKKPTLEDIDQSRLQIFRPSMFGGTLLETLAIQKDKFPNRRLPWILTTLTEQILGNLPLFSSFHVLKINLQHWMDWERKESSESQQISMKWWVLSVGSTNGKWACVPMLMYQLLCSNSGSESSIFRLYLVKLASEFSLSRI